MTAPANLTETLNRLSGAARAVADEVRADREQREADREQREAEALAALDAQRKQNRRMISLLVIVAVFVAGLVLLSVANRRLGTANAALNRQNAQIVERIESCTTIGGECYEEGNKRTQVAILQLTELTLRGEIAVARCAQTTDTDADLEQCVRHYLAVKQAPITTAPPASPTPGTPVPSPSG